MVTSGLVVVEKGPHETHEDGPGRKKIITERH